MSHQVGLTFTAAVAPGREESLRAMLRHLDLDPAHNDVLPFAELPDVHFARFLVLPEGTAGFGATTLVLTVDADGPAGPRVRDLAEEVGAGIDAVFGHCAGYPADPTSRQRRSWLAAHQENSEVFYIHAVGRTLTQILDEARLRSAVVGFVDAEHARLAALDDRGVRDAIRAFVSETPGLAPALEPPAAPGLLFRVREKSHKLAVPALLVVGLPIVVPALLLWAVAFRVRELREPVPLQVLDPDRLRALSDREDFEVMNQFTSIAPIRPGPLLRITSQLTLWIGNYTARHVFTRGSLSGLTTVHFARFKRFGPRRHLLFTSYYDGSLESYNNDFVDQVAWVLNVVFGQQEGYPRTRWMVLDGARDERGFKAFIRGHQIETQVWYTAYPDLAAVTLDQNARLRAGLGDDLDGEELRAWLELI
ncbi:hypothetical protein [Nocardioides insulae]|uniref:hypothetical protein n=1 Tax=Nocardioides insulae TaxID=394734 RepID=UPI0004169EA2|nr:hypothetical protein [Nocardioides insulae]